MMYITGDTHGDFRRVAALCDSVGTSLDDVLIILGDAEINYYNDHRDAECKQLLGNLPITLFCIHGNHEARPESTGLYETIVWNCGRVYVEKKFPNILFAKDGEIYDFMGLQTIVIGGAYSVDKFYRLEHDLRWWDNEQPSAEIKAVVEQRLAVRNYQVDVVLSHTCPLRYVPVEVFLKGIDQSTVDRSTEQWLDTVEDKLQYQKWFCGHYHTYKQIDKVEFLFESIKMFTPEYTR